MLEIESPQFFLENSDQQEINIHNVIQKWSDIKTKHVAGFILFVYGFIFPFFTKNDKIKIFFKRIGFFVPPRSLSISFLIGAVMMLDQPSGNEEEIGEFFFSVCFLLWMLLEYLKIDGQPPTVSQKLSIYTGISLTLLIAVVFTLMPTTPLFGIIPGRDSDVFLYIGQQILDGQIPYRDIWDHKGPVIYYLDALGLFIDSMWGLWLIEFLSLTTAVLLGYIVMSQVFGHLPALFSSLTWLTSFAWILKRGNYVEEYALPFHFAALYLFWYSEKKGNCLRCYLLIGLTMGICFLLRPNNIGMQLSIVLLTMLYGLFRRSWRETIIKILAIALGAMIFITSVLLYFASHNALGALISAMLEYNFLYSSSTTLSNRLNSIQFGLELISNISFIALTAWVVASFYVWHKASQPKNNLSVVHLSLIGLPIEFGLSTLSGKTLLHYYMLWLPLMAFLTAFLAFLLLENVPKVKFWNQTVERYFAIFIFVIALFVVNSSFVKNTILKSEEMLAEKNWADYIIDYLSEETGEDGYLLMWGAESKFNFLTNKPSPTRFVYQYALYTEGYSTPEMAQEFLYDIETKKPLIIDTAISSPNTPPIDGYGRELLGFTDDYLARFTGMTEVLEYINQNYELVNMVQPGNWPVYKYVGDK